MFFRSMIAPSLLSLFLVPTSAQAQSAKAPAAAWLAGCWEQKGPGRETLEQWMAPSGGLMMGMSRTVARDTAREFEHLRIDSRKGVPTYVALPSGQAEASFPATVVTDTLLVFSNPAHDFPQQIRYRRIGKDSIVARIEGTRGGQVRGINFPMRRTRCGGESP